MEQRFLETDQGFINVRSILRIFWDEETDGWAIWYGKDDDLAYPKSEDAVLSLLGVED